MSDILTTGKCLCGEVKYTITGEPLRMIQCHCKDCQRATGTGHISNAFFKKDQVEISGELKSFDITAASGNTNRRHFCPNCGSRIYNEITAREGIIGIHVGCCDNNDWYEPNAVIYTDDRAGWDLTSADVPNHAAMPPPPPAK